MIKVVSVIGAGTMGNGIAQVFAQNNYKVNLIDVNENQLIAAINSIKINLQRLLKKSAISQDSAKSCLKNINTSTELEKNVRESDLVIEAIVENLELKQQLFIQLSDLCSENCILASNTSSISISKIATKVQFPERVIGIHFMNPVPIMPLVEIIKGKNTSEKTVSSILSICKNLNKTPVLANDFPGFVANRILMPMINEAILTLEQGVAGVKEIDDIMILGMAHPMGPLLLADYIGLDVCLSIMNVLYEGFNNNKYKPAPLLEKLVNNKELGKKSNKGFYTYAKNQEPLPNQFSA